MKKEIIAIMYDFDRTLATQDMQNFGFIPSLGMNPAQFWGKTEEFCKKFDTDRILGYMYVMIHEAKKQNIKMTREFLKNQGINVTFFRGVTNWFKRINEYADSKGLKCEHYLITSGNKEIVEGTAIAKEFANIFGCEYHFDEETEEACWPINMVNYTQKTQYFFKISKGVYKNNEDSKVNEKTLERRILYRNMIYFGDGMTDVPIMILVKNNGGTSIAVYKPGDEEKVAPLFNDGRVNFVCKADYSENKEIDKIVKLIIDNIAIQTELSNRCHIK
ncbi:MAG: HAD family hydrolase [Bacillales bacterium]